MHDDLQMMRQLEMEKCFRDFQIPCRWVPDMGYGYGFPLFNFYPPLPYLVGQVFRVIGFSFVETAKLTFALSFILSGIAMYFLAKEFFGRWGGILSAVFYIWAPYHAVDVYVRGAMNEAWALVWFPAILLFSYKFINSKIKKSENLRFKILNLFGIWNLDFGAFVGLTLSWVGLFLSHNLMVMIFTPVFAVWSLIFWIKDRNVKKAVLLALSGLFALSLSAFFTLPAIFEQKYIHVDTLTQGYYEYIAHFATIGQLLFSRFWGYGASIWGPNDGLSFQIGQVHWILSLVILGLVAFRVIKKRKFTYTLCAITYSLIFGWFAAFMAHQNSTFIWQKIPVLAFVQFPWRFLTLVILGFSFAAGSLPMFLKSFGKLKFIIPGFLIILLLAMNWNYFLPQGGRMGNLTDEQKFSGAAWDLQRTAGIFDYLPKTAKENPKSPPSTLAEIIDGGGLVTGKSQGTNWAKFDVDLKKDSTVRVNIFDFPIWKAEIDGKKTQITVPKDEKWGRIYLNIPEGKHSVYLKLTDTPIRTAANFISLFAWLGLGALFIFRKKFFHAV